MSPSPRLEAMKASAKYLGSENLKEFLSGIQAMIEGNFEMKDGLTGPLKEALSTVLKLDPTADELRYVSESILHIDIQSFNDDEKQLIIFGLMHFLSKDTGEKGPDLEYISQLHSKSSQLKSEVIDEQKVLKQIQVIIEKYREDREMIIAISTRLLKSIGQQIP